MKHTSFYFRHDYNARNDELLLMLRSEHGAEAYGIFWMILETMAEASTGQINRVALGGLSLGFGLPRDRLVEIVDYCVKIGIFMEKDGIISSRRMQSHLADREVLRVAGRKGAEQKRYAKLKSQSASASESQKNSHPSTRGEERREEERKEEKNLVSTIQGGHPGVSGIIKAMKDHFGGLDDSEQKNRRYAWLLWQKAKKNMPNATDDAVSAACVELVRAASQHEFWGNKVTKVEHLYRNAKRITQDLREKERSSNHVFIS